MIKHHNIFNTIGIQKHILSYIKNKANSITKHSSDMVFQKLIATLKGVKEKMKVYNHANMGVYLKVNEVGSFVEEVSRSINYRSSNCISDNAAT